MINRFRLIYIYSLFSYSILFIYLFKLNLKPLVDGLQMVLLADSELGSLRTKCWFWVAKQSLLVVL